MNNPNDPLSPITAWAQSRPDVYALILVGSQARDAAKPASDYDLVFLVDEPSYYLGKEEWVHQFGALTDLQDEQWGVVSTRRAFYRDGRELEFNFATPAWAALPLDRGTRQVLEGGFRILFDRHGRLEQELQRGLSS